ncbi:NTP transferase domain-containing protein [Lysobacter niabensis]|uniref:NTP transferase domain-containing protein n=1 Tax=Agrilutibacter niabensis TaxID=380628 RepID=UPI00360CC7BF
MSAATGHDHEAGDIPATLITLGVLAGGQATRLGGVDKAWMERDGLPQVLRWQRRFARETGAMLVSANRHLSRYEAAGLHAVPDRIAGDFGPIAGLDALLGHCRTPWLLTIPVDLVGVNDCLLPSLSSGRSDHGAFAHDDDGPQPLVALWRVGTVSPAVSAAIHRKETAIHALQARLGMAGVRFEGVRFGNLNTPEDLRAAGFFVDAPRND